MKKVNEIEQISEYERFIKELEEKFKEKEIIKFNDLSTQAKIWLKENFDFYDNDYELKNHYTGYENSENEANCFFKSTEYPNSVRLLWINKDYCLTTLESYPDCDEQSEVEDLYIFNDAQLLNQTLLDKYGKFEETSVKILHFEQDTGCHVEVNKEYNNSGNFMSYNIYSGDDLILDGLFELNDLAIEETKKAVSLLNESFIIGKLQISNIKKVSGFPSWNKSYTFTANININGVDYGTEVEIDIKGMQGQKRNVLEFIEYEIDEDAIITEIISDNDLEDYRLS